MNVIQIFQNTLITPKLAGKQVASREYKTKFVLAMMGITAFCLTIPILLFFVLGVFDLSPLLIMIVFNLVTWIGWVLADRGLLKIAGHLPAAIFFSLGMYLSYKTGLYTTGVLFYALAILLTAMLHGVKAQWLVVGLSLFAHVGLGWLHDRSSIEWPLSVAILAGAAFVGISLLEWFSKEQLHRALEQARATNDRLEQRTAELLIANQQLQQEIAERKQAEAAWRESEQKFQNLAEKSPNMIYINQNGRIVYANEACETIMGYSRAEYYAPNFDFMSLVAPESVEQVKEYFQVHMQGQEVDTYEFELLTKDGRRIQAINSSRLIALEGEPAILGVVTDVSQLKQVEELLRESEERYYTLFENAPIGLGLADDRGNLLAYNKAMLEPGGYTRQEIARIGNVVGLYYDPEQRARVLAIAKEQGFLNRHEVQFKRMDGTPYDALLSLKPVSIDGRQAFQAMVEDITEWKKAEQALRESEAKYRDLVESSLVGVYKTTLKGDILFVNEATWRMFEFDSAEEMISQGVVVRYKNPKDRDLLIEKLRQTGKIVAYEAQVLTKTGKTKTILINATPSGDNLTGMLMDITEIKQAESDLQALKEFNEDIVNGVREGIVIQDTNNIVTFCNPSIADLLGYSPEEILGKPWLEFVPPDQKAIVKQAFQQRLRGFSSRYELALNHKDGSRLSFLISGTPRFENGRFTGTLAVLTNITKLKQAEFDARRRLKQVQALREIDLAISSSHELRLTLNILLDHVTRQLAVDAGTVLVYQPGMQSLDYAASRGFVTTALQHSHLRIGEGHAGLAALERRTVTIPNLQADETSFERSPSFPNEKFVAYFAIPLIAKGQIQGVMELFHRAPLDPDREWLNLLDTLAGQAAIAIENAQMFTGLEQSHLNLSLAYDVTLEGWAKALELRDAETEGHSQRVTDMTMRLARAARIKEEQLIHVRRGAVLHDIGKMGIPDSILLKTGPLNEDEWEIMRMHPTFAFNMLSPIEYLRPALEIPYCHHERWDGSGYPRGLKGEQIPLPARIFAVVDVWDALLSDRPYRPAWSKEAALEHIRKSAGGHFDPQVVEVFLQLLGEEIPAIVTIAGD